MRYLAVSNAGWKLHFLVTTCTQTEHLLPVRTRISCICICICAGTGTRRRARTPPGALSITRLPGAGRRPRPLAALPWRRTIQWPGKRASFTAEWFGVNQRLLGSTVVTVRTGNDCKRSGRLPVGSSPRCGELFPGTVTCHDLHTV